MAQRLASRFVLLGPDGVPERSLPVTRERLVIGRSADSDVLLDDPQVSRHHAELRHDHGSWVLRDLGSTAGTTRDGRRLDRPVLLHHGDVIGLGPVRLRFELDDAEPPTTVGPPVAAAVPRPRPPAPHESRRPPPEVSAGGTRAGWTIWLGVLLAVAGSVAGVTAAGGSLPALTRALADGVPGIVGAAALGAAGVLLVAVGVVLHAVDGRTRADHRLPRASLERTP